MSKAYRQTLSDELFEKVEDTRRRFGLSVQELTVVALTLFCQQPTLVQSQPQAPPPSDEGKLSF